MTTHPEDELAGAAAAARGLLGQPVDVVSPVAGGRNSRVYRVEAGGRRFALKRYPARDHDPRDRLGAEAAALALMERHEVARVPRLVACDERRGYALLTWLEGVPVTQPSTADVDAVVAFLAEMHGLRRCAGLPSERLASEACLSGAEIIRQIEARRGRLHSAADVDLEDFLAGPFAARLAAEVDRAASLAAVHAIDMAAELPHEKRSLVPSDFGFHNSVRMSDGSLAFFDFEYFGWDDPVKMTADVMLHPGTDLSDPQRAQFRRGTERIYGDDPTFRPRLTAYYPLIGLRWVLILLNDFLPERSSQPDAQARRAGQLAKARAFLGRLGEAHGVG